MLCVLVTRKARECENAVLREGCRVFALWVLWCLLGGSRIWGGRGPLIPTWANVVRRDRETGKPTPTPTGTHTRARERLGENGNARLGRVCGVFPQRFGGSLNLNTHVHVKAIQNVAEISNCARS